MDNFSVFWKNEKTADVTVGENSVEVKRYSTSPAKQLFYKDRITRYELGEILRLRCWDENRDHLERYLNAIGLREFDPYKICRKTHGVMVQDPIWFCFEGEDLRYEDVKFRE